MILKTAFLKGKFVFEKQQSEKRYRAICCEVRHFIRLRVRRMQVVGFPLETISLSKEQQIDQSDKELTEQ
jgi:hypothetical protein